MNDNLKKLRRQRTFSRYWFNALLYSILLIVFRIIIDFFSHTSTSYNEIILNGFLFGLGMGFWSLYYKRTAYFEKHKKEHLVKELDNLGFKKAREFKANRTLFTRKAYEKFGFTEDVILSDLEDYLEVETTKNYVNHLINKISEAE